MALSLLNPFQSFLLELVVHNLPVKKAKKWDSSPPPLSYFLPSCMHTLHMPLAVISVEEENSPFLALGKSNTEHTG